MNAFNSCDGTSIFIPHENICTIALITIHYLYIMLLLTLDNNFLLINEFTTTSYFSSMSLLPHHISHQWVYPVLPHHISINSPLMLGYIISCTDHIYLMTLVFHILVCLFVGVKPCSCDVIWLRCVLIAVVLRSMCCHTRIPCHRYRTWHPTPSQYTDTGPTCRCAIHWCGTSHNYIF